MLAVVAATALSYEQDRPHRLPSLHPAHDIRFDYAWTHKDDGPPEPRWRGQRVVGISQGTTGTHATFEAVSKLGLPAAHWFDQHRPGSGAREKVPHKAHKTGVQFQTSPSAFAAHDRMLWQYGLAKECARAAAAGGQASETKGEEASNAPPTLPPPVMPTQVVVSIVATQSASVTTR